MGAFRILVADDNQELCAILLHDLTTAGYDAITVSDGEEAMACLKQTPFDLAILDIKMPKADGLAVLKFAKEILPKIKVIMLTAYGDLKHLMESHKHRADAFLSKPYDLDELRFTIRRLLEPEKMFL